MSQYLRFERQLQDERGKTQIWAVISVRSDEILGFIRWYSRWRQYTFQPEFDTIYNPECLRDISDAISGLMAARRLP